MPQLDPYSETVDWSLKPVSSEEYLRASAKRYITKRLREGSREDVIEELSAYLGAWMYSRQKVRQWLDSNGVRLLDERSNRPK